MDALYTATMGKAAESAALENFCRGDATSWTMVCSWQPASAIAL